MNTKSHNRNRSLICLTNIPTPYRVHFYNRLAIILSQQNIHLKVVFMAQTEPGRFWNIDTHTMIFSYEFPRGIHPLIKRRQFHINLGFLLRLLISSPDLLLISGSWFFPTTIIARWLAHLRGAKTLFWNESNLTYIEHTTPMVEHLRGIIIRGFDGYVVPGKWAKDYIMHYYPNALEKPFLQLPNVIDETFFREGTKKYRLIRTELLDKWEIQTNTYPIFLCVARLEPIKGILQLAKSFLSSPLLAHSILLIAGDGSLKKDLSKLIAESTHYGQIRLLGHKSETDIVELYSLADAFILPSIGDAYPLSVIEAAFAGLPLLLSNRVGCHPEILEPGDNGFLFDPYIASEITNVLVYFQGLSKETWQDMGKKSSELAEERFNTQKVLSHFVQELKGL